MNALSMTTMDTPVGELTLVAGAAGLRAVLWPDERDGRVPLGDLTGGGPESDAVLVAAHEQLREYFAGERREFDLPLDPVGTPFQQQAWQVLRTIPFGRVDHLRRAGGAVGRHPEVARCRCSERSQPDQHRGAMPPSCGQHGRLTGFAGGLEAKAWLLRHEQAGPRS